MAEEPSPDMGPSPAEIDGIDEKPGPPALQPYDDPLHRHVGEVAED
jgi:hypothetical protein